MLTLIRRFVSKAPKQSFKKVQTPSSALLNNQKPASKAIETLFGASIKNIESLKKESEFLKMQKMAEKQAILSELKEKKISDNALKLSESVGSRSTTKIYYTIRGLRDIQAILTYFNKNKFYLTDSHVLLMLKRISQLQITTSPTSVGKRYRDDKIQRRNDFFNDKRMGDFINNLELNFLNYEARSRLQILLYLARLSKKEFKTFIQQRLGLMANTNISENLTLKETMLTLWLCAAVDYDQEEMIGKLDKVIIDKFNLILFEKSGSEVDNETSHEDVELSDDETGKTESQEEAQETKPKQKDERREYDFYARPLSLAFWAYDELKFKSDVPKMINLKLLEGELLAKTSYNTLVNYILGLSILNNKNQIKFLKAFSDRVMNENNNEFSKFNDLTQVNILKSLSKLRSNHEYLEDCAKKLLVDFMKNRNFLSPKNLSIVMWHLTVYNYEISDKHSSTLFRLIEQDIPNMNSHNATLVLYSLYRQQIKGRQIFGENKNVDVIINLVIDRLVFLARNINKKSQDFLLEIKKAELNEFKRVRELVNYFN